MESGSDGPARSQCAARLRLRCELCDATLLSQQQLEQHLNGRRHKERLRDQGLSEEDLHDRAERNLRNLVLGGYGSNAAVDGRDLAAEVKSFVRAVPGVTAASVPGRVLLYYKYTDVDDPAGARQWQLDLCSALNLRGRIHVATEGINGTVGGPVAATTLYVAAMEHHAHWGSVFSGIDYKESEGDASAFPNLFVKLCDEIIALGCSTSKISWRDSADHLEPAEFHRMLLKHAAQQSCSSSAASDSSTAGGSSVCESQGNVHSSHSQPVVSDDSINADTRLWPGQSPTRETRIDADNSSLVLLDCRNLYESEIGRFDGAVRCPTRHFTEFPAVADKMVEEMQLRDKTVLMYCTGGIRCERASAYLRSVGVRDCFQLKGGIARYCEAFPPAEAATAAPAPLTTPARAKPDTTTQAGFAPSEQNENEDSCSPSPPCATMSGISTRVQNSSMFRGKNFVFDRRMALPAGRDIVGECALCGAAWDQYDRNTSCDNCSALVLLCAECRACGHGSTQLTGRRKRKQADGSGSDSRCNTDDDKGTVQLLCTYCRSSNPNERFDRNGATRS